MNNQIIYKIIAYISILLLIEGFLLIGVNYVEASDSEDFYVFTGSENTLANDKDNWDKYSINLNHYPLVYENIGHEVPTIDANLYFLDYHGNVTFNLNNTFGDVFLLSTFNGSIFFTTNTTFDSLSVNNGKIIINNTVLFITGSVSFNQAEELNKIPQIPSRNYDIGLTFIILGASMPFIGFIIKYLKDKRGN